jgi:hypothetical protein
MLNSFEALDDARFSFLLFFLERAGRLDTK